MRCGFNLNKAKAAKEEILQSFTPLELNEGNVRAIFNRCLATEEDQKNRDLILDGQVLQENTVGTASKAVLFPLDKIYKNQKNINYLLGQLEDTHLQTPILHLQDGTRKYDQTLWTADTEILFQLYSLAIASKYFFGFVSAKGNIYAEKIKKLRPTLSPKDPAFPARWEAHKAEWEQ